MGEQLSLANTNWPASLRRDAIVRLYLDPIERALKEAGSDSSQCTILRVMDIKCLPVRPPRPRLTIRPKTDGIYDDQFRIVILPALGALEVTVDCAIVPQEHQRKSHLADLLESATQVTVRAIKDARLSSDMKKPADWPPVAKEKNPESQPEVVAKAEIVSTPEPVAAVEVAPKSTRFAIASRGPAPKAVVTPTATVPTSARGTRPPSALRAGLQTVVHRPDPRIARRQALLVQIGHLENHIESLRRQIGFLEKGMQADGVRF